jgi:hypothetical protein
MTSPPEPQGSIPLGITSKATLINEDVDSGIKII